MHASTATVTKYLDLFLIYSDCGIQKPTSDLVTPDTSSASTRIIYERLKRRQICYFLLKGGFLTLQSSSILPSSLSSSLPLVLCVQFMVKALEILELSAPSAPKVPPIKFSLILLLRALALKKPGLTSHICTQSINILP